MHGTVKSLTGASGIGLHVAAAEAPLIRVHVAGKYGVDARGVERLLNSHAHRLALALVRSVGAAKDTH